MEDFKSCAHNKKKSLLKSCNQHLSNFNLKIFKYPVETFSEAPNPGMFGDPKEEKLCHLAEEFMREEFIENLKEMVSWLRKEWLWLPKSEIDIGKLKIEYSDHIGSHSNLGIYDLEYFLAQGNHWKSFLFSIKFIKEELNRIKEWIKNERDRREKEIYKKIYNEIKKPDEQLIRHTEAFIRIAKEKLNVHEELHPVEEEYIFGNVYWISQYLTRLYHLILKKLCDDVELKLAENEKSSWRSAERSKVLLHRILKIKVESSHFVSLYEEGYTYDYGEEEVEEFIEIITDEIQKYFSDFWLAREKNIKKNGLKKKQIEKLVKENQIQKLLDSVVDSLSIQNAIDAISRIENTAKLKVLIHNLNNENEHVRFTVAQYLCMHKEEGAIDSVLKILPTNDNLVNRYLIYYLSIFKEKLTIGAIRPIIDTWTKMPLKASYSSIIDSWSVTTITYSDLRRDLEISFYESLEQDTSDIFQDLLRLLFFNFGDRVFHKIYAKLKEIESNIYLKSFIKEVYRHPPLSSDEKQNLSLGTLEIILDFLDFDNYYYSWGMHFYKKSDLLQAERHIIKLVKARNRNMIRLTTDWDRYLNIRTPKEELMFFLSVFEKHFIEDEHDVISDLRFIIDNYDNRKRLEFWEEHGFDGHSSSEEN